MDAIDALTGLNEATQLFEAKKADARRLADELFRANKQLDDMQKAFDAFCQGLRENAPEGTYWHLVYGES